MSFDSLESKSREHRGTSRIVNNRNLTSKFKLSVNSSVNHKVIAPICVSTSEERRAERHGEAKARSIKERLWLGDYRRMDILSLRITKSLSSIT